MAEQRTLQFRTRGGKRPGAGRPRKRERPGIPHVRRETFRPYQPVHVTLRIADWVWNLRSERSFSIIHRALDAARCRTDSRIVHFGILGNHIHLIAEAIGERALSNSIRALSIRLARRLNRMMRRRGPVFADRYHAHVLRTPAEVRNAVRYVVGNYAVHAARWGEPSRRRSADPYSSAVVRAPRVGQLSLFPQEVVRPAETWLLATRGADLATATRP